MGIERRADGWYLDGRKLKVGDVVEAADPDDARQPGEPSTWQPYEITDFMLTGTFVPYSSNENSLDAMVKHGMTRFRWPSKK